MLSRLLIIAISITKLERMNYDRNEIKKEVFFKDLF